MTLAERLVGSWKLLSGGNYKSDGTFEPYRAFGSRPVGYLMYAPGGYMSVAMANSVGPSWEDVTDPSQAEKAASHDACFAYFGRYEVMEKEQRVVHLPEAATWPHYVGSQQIRQVRLEGDVLTLSEKEPLAGNEWRHFEIRWQRLDTAAKRAPDFAHRRMVVGPASGKESRLRTRPAPIAVARTGAARRTGASQRRGKDAARD
jgi:hypothetical protein